MVIDNKSIKFSVLSEAEFADKSKLHNLMHNGAQLNIFYAKLFSFVISI